MVFVVEVILGEWTARNIIPIAIAQALVIGSLAGLTFHRSLPRTCPE